MDDSHRPLTWKRQRCTPGRRLGTDQGADLIEESLGVTKKTAAFPA